MGRSIGAQLERIGALVDFIVRSEVGPEVYQGSLDGAALLDQEEELLNEDAQALTDLLRENEQDARAKKYFGVESYSQLSPAQRLKDVALYMPIASSESEDQVLEARLRVQDKISEMVRSKEPSVSHLTLFSYGVDFTHMPSFRVYSATSNGEKEPIIHMGAHNLLAENPSLHKAQSEADGNVAEHIRWLLDKVEDQAVALIYPNHRQPD